MQNKRLPTVSKENPVRGESKRNEIAWYLPAQLDEDALSDAEEQDPGHGHVLSRQAQQPQPPLPSEAGGGNAVRGEDRRVVTVEASVPPPHAGRQAEVCFVYLGGLIYPIAHNRVILLIISPSFTRIISPPWVRGSSMCVWICIAVTMDWTIVEVHLSGACPESVRVFCENHAKRLAVSHHALVVVSVASHVV